MHANGKKAFPLHGKPAVKETDQTDLSIVSVFEHQLHLYQIKYTSIVHIRDQVRKGVYREQDVEKVIRHAQADKKVRSKAGFILETLKQGWYERMAVQVELSIPPSSPPPTNGYWGEVQEYWQFSEEQMAQLRERYNEHTLKTTHYKKSLYFDQTADKDQVFASFLETPPSR